MKLPQTQSKAPHYAANFKSIALFVNQCFVITDAITVTACNAFFFFLFALRLCSHHKQLVNVSSFLGITNTIHCLTLPAVC